jgi:hypothetical protein
VRSSRSGRSSPPCCRCPRARDGATRGAFSGRVFAKRWQRRFWHGRAQHVRACRRFGERLCQRLTDTPLPASPCHASTARLTERTQSAGTTPSLRARVRFMWGRFSTCRPEWQVGRRSRAEGDNNAEGSVRRPRLASAVKWPASEVKLPGDSWRSGSGRGREHRGTATAGGCLGRCDRSMQP